MKLNLALSILLSFLLFNNTNVFAQAKIKFEKEIHEFGTVIEGEQAVYEFKFKNEGDQPIILSNVRPSCGCTSPFYTQDPVLPGKTGVIKVSYNSSGRMGVFDKSISVTSNAEPSTVTLRIKGIVDKVDLNKTFTAAELKKSPKLKFAKEEHNFGKIEVNKAVVYKFVISNASGVDPLKIIDVSSPCRCVTYTINKESINNGETTELEIKFTPRYTGNITEKVDVYSNDLHNQKQTITLKADVVNSLAPSNMLQQGGSGGF